MSSGLRTPALDPNGREDAVQIPQDSGDDISNRIGCVPLPCDVALRLACSGTRGHDRRFQLRSRNGKDGFSNLGNSWQWPNSDGGSQREARHGCRDWRSRGNQSLACENRAVLDRSDDTCNVHSRRDSDRLLQANGQIEVSLIIDWRTVAVVGQNEERPLAGAHLVFRDRTCISLADTPLLAWAFNTMSTAQAYRPGS